MKRRIRTTEIKVETEELYLLRQSPKGLRTWCAACGREVWMVTPERAAKLAGVSPRTIYRWIENGKVHFTEAGRVLLVCLGSL